MVRIAASLFILNADDPADLLCKVVIDLFTNGEWKCDSSMSHNRVFSTCEQVVVNLPMAIGAQEGALTDLRQDRPPTVCLRDEVVDCFCLVAAGVVELQHIVRKVTSAPLTPSVFFQLVEPLLVLFSSNPLLFLAAEVADAVIVSLAPYDTDGVEDHLGWTATTPLAFLHIRMSGLEPPTSWSQAKRSTKLSYILETPTLSRGPGGRPPLVVHEGVHF